MLYKHTEKKSFPLSPNSGSVFLPTIMSANSRNTNVKESSGADSIKSSDAELQDTLPDGWSIMSNTEMLTAVMQSLSSQKLVLA